MDGIELRWRLNHHTKKRTLQYRIVSEGMDTYTEYGEWQDVPEEYEKGKPKP